MERVLKKKKRGNKVVYVNTPKKEDLVLSFVIRAWFANAVKTMIKMGDVAKIRLSAEEAGNEIFEGLIKRRPEKWTPMIWSELTSRYIHNPCGAGIEFTEMSDEKVVMKAFACPLLQLANEYPYATCFFSRGMWTSIWKKTFPKGMVIVNRTMGHGSPFCEFEFIVNATEEDRERDNKSVRYLSKIERGKFPKK